MEAEAALPASQAAFPASIEQYAAKAGHGPVVVRVALASHLRQRRLSAGVSMEQAAAHLKVTTSKISRLENGRRPCQPWDVVRLLQLYGAPQAHIDQLVKLVGVSTEPGWWSSFGIPKWFELLVGLEAAAERIRIYESMLVPGLLQTDHYAWHISHGDQDDEEARQRLEVRLQRQRNVLDGGGQELWVVLEEAALLRAVAPRPVMRAQMERLRSLADRSGITLQVVPFDQARFSPRVPFTHLHFAEPELADLVYIEQVDDAIYLDKADDVEKYRAKLDHLSASVLTPEQTCRRLDEAIRFFE
ncbi:helix-turn-helix domain-containing protein [Streptomyces sp. AC563]|uniref:helix-turn-helix domain-containing protein n=1 Tax=Streptomyces buecherae TaxID=2763006 RepID=UPI00164E94A5|nr:helix-turn-helix transcriptional regulator [Streptomyces buecherae]MBC3988085.1 helix-turn-helix domain-containing protein [Streptomyces buecherae]